jgi:hypothetical protein
MTDPRFTISTRRTPGSPPASPRPADSLRAASLTAGLALALMAALAAWGVFGATAPLVTVGDAAKTARDILAAEGQFRWGIACLIVVVILDVVVAGALLTLFTPVSRTLSVMAAGFRMAYAAVYLVAILQLVVALGQLSEPEQAMRAIQAYTTIWLVGLVLFGVHLLLIGYLAYRSGFIAKVFGVLLVIAGLGYVVDGFVAVLRAGPSASIAQFTFVGEVALIGWLLIAGRRLGISSEIASAQPAEPVAVLSTT